MEFTAIHGKWLSGPLTCVIVGQGLAGTALAWQLRWRGWQVLVLDREPAVTSSRIAAGLITPVTGQRMTPTWRFTDLFPVARDHYRRVEEETGVPCLYPRSLIRLFQDGDERDRFERRASSTLNGLVSPLRSPLDSGWFTAPHGGFEVPAAAQLLTRPYLAASREAFIRDSSYLKFDLDPDCDLEPETEHVRLPTLGIRARAVIFCQGHAGSGNRWFPSVKFQSARGDILTLRIPGLTEERVINRGVWLAPAGDGNYLAGSTFDRSILNDVPLAVGRAEIEGRLQGFLRKPYEVIEHHGAVRPIIDISKPLLGFHPRHRTIGFFNGLGSRGALVAPYYAAQLADALSLGSPIDREVMLSPHAEG